jgi:hypothetical protein
MLGLFCFESCHIDPRVVDDVVEVDAGDITRDEFSTHGG